MAAIPFNIRHCEIIVHGTHILWRAKAFVSNVSIYLSLTASSAAHRVDNDQVIIAIGRLIFLSSSCTAQTIIFQYFLNLTYFLYKHLKSLFLTLRSKIKIYNSANKKFSLLICLICRLMRRKLMFVSCFQNFLLATTSLDTRCAARNLLNINDITIFRVAEIITLKSAKALSYSYLRVALNHRRS